MHYLQTSSYSISTLHHHIGRSINRSIAITSQDHFFPGPSGFNEIRVFRDLAWLLEFSNPRIQPDTSFISPPRTWADRIQVMDQTHARALEALQPFVALATSNSATSPRFVASIVTNATSAPQTYVFAELLETPTIQALAAPDTPAEYKGYLKLLEIFAWGTWQDYQGMQQIQRQAIAIPIVPTR